MNATESRVAATIFIWAALTAIMIWGIPSNLGDSATVTIILILAVAAGLSTLSLWAGHGENNPKKQSTEDMPEKHKRLSQSERLATLLEEDDARQLLSALESRLNTLDEGEFVSLDQLLAEQEQDEKHHRRG